jgi:hypothetical protein
MAMVPAEYLGYFSTMAAVGATLFGLIFVAVSIVPESRTRHNTPVEREIKAITAYVALINPLTISLFALVPHHRISLVLVTMSILGLVDSLIVTVTLLRTSIPWNDKLYASPFIVIGYILYIYETQYALRIIRFPNDSSAFGPLAQVLILITIFGIIRSWELVGIRQLNIRNLLASLRISRIKGRSESNESDCVH